MAWAPDPTGPRSFPAEIRLVLDGDTIRVRIGGRVEEVRSIGADAPVLHRGDGPPARGAWQAARANRELLRGRAVRLELGVVERDRDDHLLAYVYADGVMVNAELVRRGHAVADGRPPNLEHADLLGALETQARQQGLGLWGRPEASSGPGVEPADAMACPATHPVKARLLADLDEPCIYHESGGARHAGVRPHRCYGTGAEAQQAGCRARGRPGAR